MFLNVLYFCVANCWLQFVMRTEHIRFLETCTYKHEYRYTPFQCFFTTAEQNKVGKFTTFVCETVNSSGNFAIDQNYFVPFYVIKNFGVTQDQHWQDLQSRYGTITNSS